MAVSKNEQFIGVVDISEQKILLAVSEISSVEEHTDSTTVIMKNGTEYELKNTMHDFDWNLHNNVDYIIRTSLYRAGSEE